MVEQPISFNELDAEGVQQPHNDPLVIIVVVGNYKPSRVLIDNRSFADILFAEAFRQMGIPKREVTTDRCWLGFWEKRSNR